MRTTTRWIVAAAAAALFVLAGPRTLLAATPPEVYSVVVGRDLANSGRTVVTLVGKGLTRFVTFVLVDEFMEETDYQVATLFRNGRMLVLGLDGGLPAGTYELRAATRAGDAQSFPLDGVGGVVFQGVLGRGIIPAEGPGARMMWYPRKAAFRAGYAYEDEWDDSNVGEFSFAAGRRTIASQEGSTALGFLTQALGVRSTAMGFATLASGYYSTALGDSSAATGRTSLAAGLGSRAQGSASTALGEITMAAGAGSTALGSRTVAAGAASTATGTATYALGDSSASMGFLTNARAFASVVLGQFNAVEGDPVAWVATDPVLVVGNGANDSSRSNAFTLRKDGNLAIAGNLTQASDARAKKEVTQLSGVLRRLAAIRGVSYRVKDGARGPAGPQIGLLAQEVREAFPELVQEDARGHLSVAYGNFSAVLLEAVKEQQAALDAREREVADLRREMAEERAATDARLARLEALVGSR